MRYNEIYLMMDIGRWVEPLHSSGLPDLSRGEERAGSPFMVWSPSCLSLAWRRGAEERSRGEESRREQRTAAAQTRVALHLITNKIL